MSACEATYEKPPEGELLPIEPVLEKVLIIDNSLNMWAVNEKMEMRIDRAIKGVGELGKQIIEAGGLVSIIVADDSLHVVLTQGDTRG